MNLLSELDQRLAWKYEPIHGSFQTHKDLENKVSPNGEFVPFPGSTVVFRPDDLCFDVVRMMQELIHVRLENTNMLAEKLPAYSIHMTLHDLVSPEMNPASSEGGDSEESYRNEVSCSIDEAVKIVEEIRKEFAGRRFCMVADRIVSMVSKSLVLLLRPQTEEDYELLLELYHRFDPVQKLPYPLTPHITLAYFRPGTIDGDLLREAVDAAQIDRHNAPVFEFSPEAITVQHFLDMKTYLDVPAGSAFAATEV